MGFFKGLLQALLWLGGIGGIIAAVLRAFFVDVYTVEHNGMAPNAVYGDKVLLWRKAEPDFGNVMLCEHPSNPGMLVLGRVLAFAGHTISSDRMGNVFVDSERSSKQPIGTRRFYDVTQNKLFEMDAIEMAFGTLPSHVVYVERDHTFELRETAVQNGIFLLGDNLSSPFTDSREFGEIDPLTCKGQVFMRLKPAPSNDDDLDNGYLDIIQ